MLLGQHCSKSKKKGDYAIMKNTDSGNEGQKKIVMARAAVFIMLIMATGLILYLYTVDRVKHSKTQSVDDYQDVIFDRVYSELELLNAQAYDNAKHVAQAIEEDLNELNLEELKHDLDNGEINIEMHEVIQDNIRGVALNNIKNYKNGIVVMTANGVLEDPNYERASNNNIRIWDDEIKKAWNKELERDSIQKILVHSNSLIAMEKINYLGKNHTKISEITKSELKKIYKKEGIEGLRNYQFKASAYITETGDIFGQDDIVHGVKQSNHKLIIVQEFNLYDQLKKMSPDLFETEEHILYIQQDCSITISIMYIMGLFYVASTVVLLFYFSHLYNYYLGNELGKYDKSK